MPVQHFARAHGQQLVPALPAEFLPKDVEAFIESGCAFDAGTPTEESAPPEAVMKEADSGKKILQPTRILQILLN